MKIQLKNGMIVEGTLEQIKQVAATFGQTVEGLYYSETHGWLSIRDMHTNHIRNALLKQYRAWFSTLSSLNDRELLEALRSGPTEAVFIELLKEFVSRT